MIWLIGTSIYLVVGLVLNCLFIALLHNRTLRFSRECVHNTLRWMDARSWMLLGIHTVLWLPMVGWMFFQRHRDDKMTWEC